MTSLLDPTLGLYSATYAELVQGQVSCGQFVDGWWQRTDSLRAPVHAITSRARWN
jgi:hypothetical protein